MRATRKFVASDSRALASFTRVPHTQDARKDTVNYECRCVRLLCSRDADYVTETFNSTWNKIFAERELENRPLLPGTFSNESR